MNKLWTLTIIIAVVLAERSLSARLTPPAASPTGKKTVMPPQPLVAATRTKKEMSKGGRLATLAVAFFLAGVCTGTDSTTRYRTVDGTKLGEGAKSVALMIESPLEGERFITRETLRLKVKTKGGRADLSSAMWTSSVTGLLGRGAELEVHGLTTGQHIITVTIGGANGSTGTQSVIIRGFADLWQMYRASPSQAELNRTMKDFAWQFTDGPEEDEKWAEYDPPRFDQHSSAPSKVVALARMDVLRHQAFAEPLPFGDHLSIYEHLKKYVKAIDARLGCQNNSGGGGKIFLNRWGSTWDLMRAECKSAAASDAPLMGYLGPLYLLVHEARHSEPGDSGHTACNGKENMDRSLDAGSGHAQAAMYNMWVWKYGLYDPPFIRDQARAAAISLFGRLCGSPSSSNPEIQAIVTELLSGATGDYGGVESNANAAGLPAPELITPEEGAVFETYPRHVTVRWKPVPGAAGYIVQWDYLSGGKWNSEEAGAALSQFPVSQTSFSFSFVGAQPGRWRVWALDADDRAGAKSSWREFRFTR